MSSFVPSLRVLAIVALAWVSLPGVEARAEADLLPPIDQLFAWDAKAPAREPEAASCSANATLTAQHQQARRQAAMARLAAVMRAQGEGEVEVLNNRGYAYPTQRSAQQELLMVEMEARAARQRQAGH